MIDRNRHENFRDRCAFVHQCGIAALCHFIPAVVRACVWRACRGPRPTGKRHRSGDVALGKMKAKSPPSLMTGTTPLMQAGWRGAGVNILFPDPRLETGDIFRVPGYDRAVRDRHAGVHCV